LTINLLNLLAYHQAKCQSGFAEKFSAQNENFVRMNVNFSPKIKITFIFTIAKQHSSVNDTLYRSVVFLFRASRLSA